MSRGAWRDWVERLCAGLSWSECRRMARGEPPSRPNPRQRAQQESFWLHIRPSYYHRAVTRFGYTFRLGWLSVYFFVVALLTGLPLLTWYVPTPEQAYASMGVILAGASMGRLLYNLHHLAAMGFILSAVLHLLRTLLTASYKPPRRFTWLTGAGLLMLALGLAFTGYLLLWDQLAYWAVTVGVALLHHFPDGDWLYGLVTGGENVGAATLLRFYILHILLLPGLALALLALHYYKVVRHGISLPPALETTAHENDISTPVEARRYYLMEVAWDEFLLLTWVTAALLALAIFWMQPQLQAPADPAHTPANIAAPWYFLWLQGLLKLGNPLIFGLLLPGACLLLLALLPYLDQNPHRQARRRPLALSLTALTVVALLGLSWLGLPRQHDLTSPARALALRYLPETESGPLRQLAWDALPSGNFCTDGQTPDPHTPFGRVWQDFAADASRLPAISAQSCILIDKTSPGVKRIRLAIRYQPQDASSEALLETAYRVREEP